MGMLLIRPFDGPGVVAVRGGCRTVDRVVYNSTSRCVPLRSSITLLYGASNGELSLSTDRAMASARANGARLVCNDFVLMNADRFSNRCRSLGSGLVSGCVSLFDR